MVRLVKHSEKSPVEVQTTGQAIFVCSCGLSRNPQKLCDGSHHKVQDEEDEKFYCYDENLNRKEVKEDDCHCG